MGSLARSIFNAVMPRVAPRWYQRRAFLIGARLRDMAAEPDEQFYAREYLHHLQPALTAMGAKRLLDLGCGQGRIAIPLANAGYQVTGIDWSGEAIAMARRYAGDETRVAFHEADMVEWLRAAPTGAFDAVIALEVLYGMEAWREVVREALRLVRPGGLCALGFRSRLYYLRYHARRGEWPLVERIASTREGRLGPLPFNWHTRGEIVAFLREVGFREVACVGIGALSGIEGDPLEPIARPSRLNAEDRERLLTVEAAIGGDYPDEGRYLLALARR